jgi:O-antigen ligase
VRRAAPLLLALSWASVILPSLAETLLVPKHREFTDEAVEYNVIASAISLMITLSIVVVCLSVLVRRLNSLPGDRRGVLLVALLPWIYQVTRDQYAPTEPKLGVVLYPLIMVTLWVLRPRLEQLAVVAWLGGATALLSIALAVASPARGILVSSTGTLVTPEKQILPWGILIGPLTDGNPLGQFLALGLPTVAFVSRWWRVPLVAVTTFAVVWTSSRSSLGALAAGAGFALLLAVVRPAARRATVVVVATAVTVVTMVVPLQTTDPLAFTNRGYIWQASLRVWQDHPVFGLGSQWYSQSAKYTDSIGLTAFHGHNEFVQLLVLGGVVNLVLVAILFAVLINAAAVWSGRYRRSAAGVFLLMLLASGGFEVSFSIVHRSYLMPVSVLPIAFLLFARVPQRMPATSGEPVAGAPSRRPVPSPELGGGPGDESGLVPLGRPEPG